MSDFNKTERLFEQYFKQKSKKPIFPSRITIELTNDCNLNCNMCPRGYIKSGIGYMTFNLFKKVIDEVASINEPRLSQRGVGAPRSSTRGMGKNTTLVPFFRGESLMHKDFVPMMRYAKQKSVKPIQLATNATLLNPDIIKELIKIKLDFVSFSIHVKKEKEIVIKNIEKFISIRKKMKSKLPEIQVSIVETRSIKEHVPGFVRKWLKKVDRVRVYAEHSKNGSFGSLSKKYVNERKPCLKVLTDMVIYWNGDVALCNHDWERKEFIGNVKDMSVKEIWNSKKYYEIRKRHWKKTLEDDLTCSSCDHWQMYYLPENLIGRLYTK